MTQIRRIFRFFGVFRVSRWVRVVVVMAAALAYGESSAKDTASAASASASVPQNVVPQNVEDALHQMSDRAAVIFVGQVTAVRRIDGGGVSSGVVEVEFQVDQAVRGCAAGTPYVLREWAGLWVGGDQRYRVGQRLLMLLHAPGASGMSSPVDGLDGAIPIVRGGSAPLMAGTSARVAPPAVDLRWVGTKVQRTVSYRSEPARGAHGVRQGTTSTGQSRMVRAVTAGSVTQVAPVVVMPSAAGTAAGLAGGPGTVSTPAQQASVDAVVGMLTSWQKGSHAVR